MTSTETTGQILNQQTANSGIASVSENSAKRALTGDMESTTVVPVQTDSNPVDDNSSQSTDSLPTTPKRPRLDNEPSTTSTPHGTDTPAPAVETQSGLHIVSVNLHEYEWPPNVGEHWFLQEQISEYLDVKSFKRKYPDITRRAVEKDERDYLTAQGVLGELVADFGLCALRSDEVLDLMATDYPNHLKAYNELLAKMQRDAAAKKQMEMQIIKSDSNKLAELRRKAMQQAGDWNQDMNQSRTRDRRQFWDMSTMIVQAPMNHYKRLSAAQTHVGAYPVSVTSAQYHHHFQTYEPKQLESLALNSVTNTRKIRPPSPRPYSPPPITISQAEIDAMNQVAAREKGDTIMENGAASTSNTANNETDTCVMCQEVVDQSALDYNSKQAIKCTQCAHTSHVSCLEMSAEMYAVCRAYAWMCIECKPCSQCKKLDQEDKMMFCDRCDRGYHTFCVGVQRIPSGRWVCDTFCAGSTARTASGHDSPAAVSHLSLGKDCGCCGVQINKTNKVHHRSKYRADGICGTCARTKQANREPPMCQTDNKPFTPMENPESIDNVLDAVISASGSQSTESVTADSQVKQEEVGVGQAVVEHSRPSVEDTQMNMA